MGVFFGKVGVVPKISHAFGLIEPPNDNPGSTPAHCYSKISSTGFPTWLYGKWIVHASFDEETRKIWIWYSLHNNQPIVSGFW